MPTVIEFAAAESAREALRRLIEELSRYPGSQAIKLIIYFDNIHLLTDLMLRNDDEKTFYDLLCSCLNRFLAFQLFTIFLSTNPSLLKFYDPQAFAGSARIRGGPFITHAPITETPFDCEPELLIEPKTLSIKEISTISFMARFGRPL